MAKMTPERMRRLRHAYERISRGNPEIQYKRLIQDILDFGERDVSQQETDAITRIAPNPLRFRLAKGFPMITERNLDPCPSETLPIPIWQQAIGEIFAFINGVRTQAELETFGCPNFWPKFVTKEKCAKRGYSPGDLGEGSYGPGFAKFPTTEGEPFNQFAEVLAEAKERAHLRTLFVSPWIPQYIPRRKGKRQRVLVAPCHGWVHLRILNGKLTLHMFQRSADIIVGVPSNMTQYAALTLAIAHVLGVEAYEYVHSFSDAHIYVDQIDQGIVEKLLSRESRTLPKMTLNNPPDDLFAFRREHFTLSDYNPHPGIKGIPVAI